MASMYMQSGMVDGCTYVNLTINLSSEGIHVHG